MLNTLRNVTLILLLFIYIPVIMVIILKWKKKKIKFIVLPLAIVSLPVLYFVIFSTIPYYELMPFEGKVTDADTKEPIGGAAVLAVYYDEAVTIAGTNRFVIDLQETLTDGMGGVKIPEVKEWLGDRPGTVVEAELIIFKPGYGAFPRHKRSRAVSGQKPTIRTEKIIVYELPKLKTREERKDNVIFMDSYISPLYLGAINEERKNLGLRTISMPNSEGQK